MKIKIVDFVAVRGNAHKPGDIVDLDGNDVVHLLASHRGEILKESDAAVEEPKEIPPESKPEPENDQGSAPQKKRR